MENGNSKDLNDTMRFKVKPEEEFSEAHKVLQEVYEALKEKGYDPLNQLVGYLLSGDPAYITSYNDARIVIRTIERDELLEELVRVYLEKELEEKG